MNPETKIPWYAEGLRFECQQCGDCCCGPREGYVWLAQKEVELVADMLKISVEQVLQKYCRRVGHLISLIELQGSKDCIFLNNVGNRKICMIYNVRPSQCRNWPFWVSSLKTSDIWNKAAGNCPGMNSGHLYGFEEIQQLISS
jgi:Fe-S-cluster containining protein